MTRSPDSVLQFQVPLQQTLNSTHELQKMVRKRCKQLRSRIICDEARVGFTHIFKTKPSHLYPPTLIPFVLSLRLINHRWQR